MDKKKIGLIAGAVIALIIVAVIIVSVLPSGSQQNENKNSNASNGNTVVYDPVRVREGNTSSGTASNTSSGNVVDTQALVSFTEKFIDTADFKNMNLDEYIMLDETYIFPEDRTSSNLIYVLINDETGGIWRTQSVKSNVNVGTPELIRTYGVNSYYKIPVVYTQHNKVDNTEFLKTSEFYVWVAGNGKVFGVSETVIHTEITDPANNPDAIDPDAYLERYKAS